MLAHTFGIGLLLLMGASSQVVKARCTSSQVVKASMPVVNTSKRGARLGVPVVSSQVEGWQLTLQYDGCQYSLFKALGAWISHLDLHPQSGQLAHPALQHPGAPFSCTPPAGEDSEWGKGQNEHVHNID